MLHFAQKMYVRSKLNAMFGKLTMTFKNENTLIYKGYGIQYVLNFVKGLGALAAEHNTYIQSTHAISDQAGEVTYVCCIVLNTPHILPGGVILLDNNFGKKNFT